MTLRRSGSLSLYAALLSTLVFSVSCGKKGEASSDAGATTSAASALTAPPPATAASATTVAVAAAAPAGSPPADGKYERVMVEGTTVPMINVMNGGAIVLVDTDGKKPRSWEEQYKRKRADLLTGQYDLHKTNKNNNDTFEDDPIDKEGLWVIDAKGNITKH
jgi:hypothetical protein